MTDIKKLRQEIDNIDGKLKDLFIRRLKVSGTGGNKTYLNTVYDKKERGDIGGLAGEEYANYLSGQFNLGAIPVIFSIRVSRSRKIFLTPRTRKKKLRKKSYSYRECREAIRT